MNGTSTLLIAAGIFLGTGVYSFAKQGLPKGVIAVLALASGIALLAGVLRLEVWS